MTTATSTTEQAPGPGVYPQIEDHDYHAWPYVSKSLLWRVRELASICYTADELKAALEHERPDTDALLFGRAFDDFLFYPQLAKERYAVGPTKTRGTQKWNAEQQETDKLLLTPDEIERIPNMVDSLLAHPVGCQLLRGKGANQVSVVWDDPNHEVRCKARIDRWTSYKGFPAHIDIKTCRDIDRFHFDAVDYGYYVQAAHYRNGCEHIDRLKGKAGPLRRFIFLVVEKTPTKIKPDRHRVIVREYDEQQLDAGLRVRDYWLNKYVRLHQHGEFPGESPEIQNMYVPDSIHNAYAEAYP